MTYEVWKMKNPYYYKFTSTLDYKDAVTELQVTSVVEHTQMHPFSADGKTLQYGITASDLESRYQEYYLQLYAIRYFIDAYRDFDLSLQSVLTDRADTEAEAAVNVRLTCEQGTFWLSYASDGPIQIPISELPHAIAFAWGAFFDLSCKLPVIGTAAPCSGHQTLASMSSFFTSTEGAAWYAWKAWKTTKKFYEQEA